MRNIGQTADKLLNISICRCVLLSKLLYFRNITLRIRLWNRIAKFHLCFCLNMQLSKESPLQDCT